MSGVSPGLYAVAFQPTLTPAHFSLVAAMAGHVWRPRTTLNLIDIGCGRGYAALVLAAANPGWTVIGIDRDPAAIAEARLLAGAAGLDNARFVECDFADLAAGIPAPWPPFDVAIAHGVWSWIDDRARAGIRRLLAERLAPGGLACFGYNALPGAAAEQPLQRLLRHFAAGGDDAAAAERAMTALRQPGLAEALRLRATPMLARLRDTPPGIEPAFVAHEFLVPAWRPVFHEDLAADLAAAKLDFLAGCRLADALPGLVFDPAQREILATLPPGPIRELLKDLVLPRGFRTDLFVRGTRRIPPDAALAPLALALRDATPPAAPPVLVTGTGEAALKPEAWAPIAAALASGPQSIAALVRAAPAGLTPQPGELAALLVNTGVALPVFRAPGPDIAPASARFNRAAAALHAADGTASGHFALAAPVAAGGLPADARDLALVARCLDGAVPQDLTPAERTRLAERLPVWQRFGVLPVSPAAPAGSV